MGGAEEAFSKRLKKTVAEALWGGGVLVLLGTVQEGVARATAASTCLGEDLIGFGLIRNVPVCRKRTAVAALQVHKGNSREAKTDFVIVRGSMLVH